MIIDYWQMIMPAPLHSALQSNREEETQMLPDSVIPH